MVLFIEASDELQTDLGGWKEGLTECVEPWIEWLNVQSSRLNVFPWIPACLLDHAGLTFQFL